MEARLIRSEGGEKTFALVFATGDEVIGGLTSFAKENGLGTASFTALGDFSDVDLGYVDVEKKGYEKILVEEQAEVLSLVGTIAPKEDDEPQVHAHVGLGRSDGTTRDGHSSGGKRALDIRGVLEDSPEYGHWRREKGRSYMRYGTDRASPRPGLDRPTAKPLEGRWRLERLSGALPPLNGARKEIQGERGETRFGPFPGVSFRIEERGDRFALVYRRPFSMLVDEVREGPDGSWLGEATLAGRTFGRFRMMRIPQTEDVTGRSESR